MESDNKSRCQKFYEFFITLQKEYIVAELRMNIYIDLPGKEKSKQIMEGKKQKIKDIAIRNNIKTIFPDMCIGVMSLYDARLKEQLYNEIYHPQKGGMPDFIYRDKNHRRALHNKDKRSYYMIGTNFRCVDSNNVGILVYADLLNELASIRFSNEAGVSIYSFDQITRVF